MAGKLQLAAKCLLGTTLLASGGGGVYYASTHSWTVPGLSHGTKPPAASNSLDDVASAWAEPSSKHLPDALQSSPVARSAETPPLHADVAATKPSDDRYAIPVNAPTPTVITANDTMAVKKPHHSKKGDRKPADTPNAAPVKLASHTKADDSKPEPTLATAKLVSDTTVARGQEPKDDLPTAVQVKNNTVETSGTLDALTKSSAPASGSLVKEPKALQVPDQQTNIADAASRAKQAFGSATPAAINDRYGDASPPATVSSASPKSAAVNPFGATPISALPSNSANPKSDRIEPLSATPNDMSGQAGGLQPDGNTLRPLDSGRPARAGNRNMAAKAPSPQAVPISSLHNTDMGLSSTSRSASPSDPGSELGQPIGGDGTGKPGEKALEGLQQPTLVIQKFAPGEIQVGKPAKFVLQVKNASGQSAENVTVQDEVPQGTQLISTSPNATNDAGHLVWQLGKLSPGEDRTVEMQVMPKSEGDIGSVATVSYSSQASVKTHCTMPQLAIRLTAPSQVMIGAATRKNRGPQPRQR